MLTTDRPPVATRAVVADVSRFTVPAVAFITLAVFVVGYLRLNAQSVWLDEYYSLSFAEAGRAAFVAAVRKSDGPIAAYYVLLRSWFALVHPSVAAGRILSLIFAVATIPVTYLLGRQLFDRNVGLVAATLLACNATLWTHADDMRVYSLAVLLSTTSLLFFARLLNAKTTPADAVATGFTNGLLLCFQFVIGLSTVLAQIASVPLLDRDRPRNRALALAFALSVLSIVVVGFALRHLGTTQSAWIPHLSPRRILAALSDLSGRIAAFTTLAIAIAFAFVQGRRRYGRSIWIVASWVLAPTLGVLIVSVVRSLFLERYLLSALIPILLLAAAGIVSAKPRSLVALLLAVVVASELYGVRANFRTPRENWALASARIIHSARPGDVVDVYPAWATVALVTQMHLQHEWFAPHVTLLPETFEEQWSLGTGVPESLPEKYFTGANTVWVIVRDAALWPPPAGFDALLKRRAQYRLCSSDDSLRIVVLEFRKQCPAEARSS